MKILLFGISNVGKTTIGKLLSKEINYKFDDLDDEIIRRYNKIDNFQKEYPNDYQRHKIRGEILSNLVDKYEDNVVIAISPIFYEEFFADLLVKNNIIAIELQDKPENILKRLVYSDENDNIHPLIITTNKQRDYYLNDIIYDIKYYKKEYRAIKLKFDIQGEKPLVATKRLTKYLEDNSLL